MGCWLLLQCKTSSLREGGKYNIEIVTPFSQEKGKEKSGDCIFEPVNRNLEVVTCKLKSLVNISSSLPMSQKLIVGYRWSKCPGFVIVLGSNSQETKYSCAASLA